MRLNDGCGARHMVLYVFRKGNHRNCRKIWRFWLSAFAAMAEHKAKEATQKSAQLTATVSLRSCSAM
jgi:hypothetical protein